MSFGPRKYQPILQYVYRQKCHQPIDESLHRAAVGRWIYPDVLFNTLGDRLGEVFGDGLADETEGAKGVVADRAANTVGGGIPAGVSEYEPGGEKEGDGVGDALPGDVGAEPWTASKMGALSPMLGCELLGVRDTAVPVDRQTLSAFQLDEQTLLVRVRDAASKLKHCTDCVKDGVLVCGPELPKASSYVFNDIFICRIHVRPLLRILFLLLFPR